MQRCRVVRGRLLRRCAALRCTHGRPPSAPPQINAGQANAATGELGYQDSLASADAVAAALGVARDDVLLESTGVIGRRIKMEPLLAAVPQLAGWLGSGADDARRAAVAITTTDLVSKSAALEVELGPGHTVRLGGIAKGSGMIHPNM